MTDDNKDQLLELVYAVVDQINEDQSDGEKLIKDPGTVLYGEAGVLTSIDVVRLVVLYEQKVRSATGREISIADDRAMSQRRSPFRTIGTLVDYVSLLLQEP